MSGSLERTLGAALLALVGCGRFTFTCGTDAKGVATGWCVLEDKGDLTKVAAYLGDCGARLITITAWGADKAVEGGDIKIAYHFDLEGDVLTVTVLVPRDEAVDSLTPLFGNADWPEREMAELYGVKIAGHPDPERLFIDESLGEAVLDRYIPYSSMANAATTKGMWDKVMARSKERSES